MNTRIRFQILIVTIICLAGQYGAKAQSNFPEFSLSNEINSNDMVDMNEANFDLKTPLMRDVLTLQTQINLLKGLLKRQSEIKSIADNYKVVGIPFTQPKPAESVCEKLPVNLLCLRSHPDLEVNQDFIEKSQANLIQEQKKNIVESIENINLGNGNDSSRSVTEAKATEYYWSDIQCLQGVCSAVIEYEGERVRVSEGDEIESNKVTVISPDRVVLTINDKPTSIPPLSINGNQTTVSQLNPETPLVDNSDISNLISENIQDNLTEVPDVDFSAELGPTGLF